ncbi:iron-sulfur cluster assembly scaffold protein [Erythrobacteraceae bacterium E2-1 Yellow Sea]|nr:iron-sulfur cluster assembly scaffold protein [Erythrobacteraceae bacterium E2-1 Yellow Sea]
MSAGSTGKLYTPQLLALATQLAVFPLDREFQLTASLRSRSCGSTLSLGLDLDQDGRICAIGMKVSACAVGQASATVMAQSMMGQSVSCIMAATDEIDTWLAGKGNLPELSGFAVLEAAQPYHGRHEALLLPWKAACDALSNAHGAS